MTGGLAISLSFQLSAGLWNSTFPFGSTDFLKTHTILDSDQYQKISLRPNGQWWWGMEVWRGWFTQWVVDMRSNFRPPVSLEQSFSIRAIWSPRGHLAVSGVILGCLNSGQGSNVCRWYLVGKAQGCWSLQSMGQPLQQRTIPLKCKLCQFEKHYLQAMNSNNEILPSVWVWMSQGP
jgi:hypothetical protein